MANANEKNKLGWLFLLMIIIYIGLFFLYYRQEKRLERLKEQLHHIEEMQTQIEKNIKHSNQNPERKSSG